MSSSPPSIVVVIGVGCIGLAITRRIAHGRKLLIAGRNEGRLSAAAQNLINDGHDVTTQGVDVADYNSVESLALAAKVMGTIDVIVSTAGLTSTIATPNRKSTYSEQQTLSKPFPPSLPAAHH
jgi:NADP-dependent 3-hydroxy acid dehydrogenase YdfG